MAELFSLARNATVAVAVGLSDGVRRPAASFLTYVLPDVATRYVLPIPRR